MVLLRSVTVRGSYDSEETRDATNLEDPNQAVTMEALRVGGSVAGVSDRVTTRDALSFAPVWQCVSAISGDCAKLPINVYGPTDRGRAVYKKHPVQLRIHRNAKVNEEVNGFKFWRRFYASACLWGNAYAWIDRSNRGEVLGLYQLLPDRTWIERRNGTLLCKTQSGGGTKTLSMDDILHVEGMSIDGVSGMHIVQQFRKEFLVALGQKDFLVGFYRNNLMAGGVLQAKPGTKPGAIRAIEKRLQENFSGSNNAFKTVVLRDNFVWHKTQVTPAEAELSAQAEQSARQVCRIFNMPPSRIGLANSVSYNSEESAKQNYFDGALSHLLIATAAECTTKLLTDQERLEGLYIEHNVNALLWADAKTRSEIANTGIQSGRWSPNETREWENANGYDGGDNYYMPMNISIVGQRPRPPRGASGRGAGGEGSEPQTDSQANEAWTKLATSAFQRAITRAELKLSRGKSLDEDRDTITEIVHSVLEPLGQLIQRDLSHVAKQWFDTLLTLDSTSFRAEAESSYRTLLALNQETDPC